MVIVAPTGVAAINAGGMTIHSLFQLPFGLHLPDTRRQEEHRKFSRQKMNLIRSLELLVIDEISMVRADLLDAVDEALRRFRGDDRPFGKRRATSMAPTRDVVQPQSVPSDGGTRLRLVKGG